MHPKTEELRNQISPWIVDVNLVLHVITLLVRASQMPNSVSKMREFKNILKISRIINGNNMVFKTWSLGWSIWNQRSTWITFLEASNIYFPKGYNHSLRTGTNYNLEVLFFQDSIVCYLISIKSWIKNLNLWSTFFFFNKALKS